MDQGRQQPVLIFDDATSEQVELDLRGTLAEILERLPIIISAPEPARSRGRPKLGVVAREVTLLPRHWDWLASQPGGASVALRKLVEKARLDNESPDRLRRAKEICYKFMSVMAGNEPGFEEASRALFAGNAERFEACVAAWPADVRGHVRKLAQEVWATA